MKRTLALILLASLTLTLASAQDKKDKRAERKARMEQAEIQAAKRLDSLLQAKSFTFIAEQMYTKLAQMPYRDVSVDQFNVEVNNKKIRSRLPYFGFGKSAIMYNRESPLRFDSEVLKMAIIGDIYDRKKGARIEIDTINEEGRQCHITIKVFDNGQATLLADISGYSVMEFKGYVRDEIASEDGDSN